MPHPIHSFTDKHLGQNFLPLLKQQLVGWVEDFWADGPENLLGLDFGSKPAKKPGPAAPAKPSFNHEGQWHAAPGELSEKMWGDGFTMPGDRTLNSLLITPLNLTKAMTVLDLSAGLGTRMIKAMEETGATIIGLDPDMAIAERGVPLAISYYDPAHIMLDQSYDAFIARDVFYRVADRPAFFGKLVEHAKPNAQIAFTDYILDPEHRGHPAILAWLQSESNAAPMGLVEAAEAWAKLGFSIDTHEDLTSFYKSEIMEGLKRLMQFLGSGVRPDKETAMAVLRRLDIWKARLSAMDAGLKFCRFHGAKH